MHEDVANLKCDHCIFKCRNESQLQEHIKCHHHYPCTECEQISKKALKTHKKEHATLQVVQEKKIARKSKKKHCEPKDIEFKQKLEKKKC